MQTGEANNSASTVLAAALGNFTALISESLKLWQEHQSYSNAGPEIQKKFDNLLLMKRICAMEMAGGTGTGGHAIAPLGLFSTPIVAQSIIITPALKESTGGSGGEHATAETIFVE
jgi:hypothetical protein